MALDVKNLVKLTLDSPKMGEAFKSVQDYVNENVSPAAGNYQQPPHLNGLPSVNPTIPPK